MPQYFFYAHWDGQYIIVILLQSSKHPCVFIKSITRVFLWKSCPAAAQLAGSCCRRAQRGGDDVERNHSRQNLTRSWFKMEVGMATLVMVALAGLVGVAAQNMPRQMTVAAIFDQGGDMKYELAFKHAVQMINQNR